MRQIDINIYYGDNNNLDICLDEVAIEELFEDAFDGFCPVCRAREIDDGETICCVCLEAAIVWHRGHCGCVQRKEKDQ